MSEFAGNELLKTIRSAMAAYINLHTAELEAKGASLEEIEELIREKVEKVKRCLTCAAECESAYQKCRIAPGSNPNICAAQRTECLADCPDSV